MFNYIRWKCYIAVVYSILNNSILSVKTRFHVFSGASRVGWYWPGGNDSCPCARLQSELQSGPCRHREQGPCYQPQRWHPACWGWRTQEERSWTVAKGAPWLCGRHRSLYSCKLTFFPCPPSEFPPQLMQLISKLNCAESHLHLDMFF